MTPERPWPAADEGRTAKRVMLASQTGAVLCLGGGAWRRRAAAAGPSLRLGPCARQRLSHRQGPGKELARRVKADEHKQGPERKRPPSAAVERQLRCREASEKLKQTSAINNRAKKAEKTADAPPRECAPRRRNPRGPVPRSGSST